MGDSTKYMVCFHLSPGQQPEAGSNPTPCTCSDRCEACNKQVLEKNQGHNTCKEPDVDDIDPAELSPEETIYESSDDDTDSTNSLENDGETVLSTDQIDHDHHQKLQNGSKCLYTDDDGQKHVVTIVDVDKEDTRNNKYKIQIHSYYEDVPENSLRCFYKDNSGNENMVKVEKVNEGANPATKYTIEIPDRYKYVSKDSLQLMSESGDHGGSSYHFSYSRKQFDDSKKKGNAAQV